MGETNPVLNVPIISQQDTMKDDCKLTSTEAAQVIVGVVLIDLRVEERGRNYCERDKVKH